MTSPPRFEVRTSNQFTSFLAEHRISLAVTTYQAGKLFLLGVRPDGRLSIFERTLERCMGLCVADGVMDIATLYQIWRFRDVLTPGVTHQDRDSLFAPRQAWVTGDLDVHDLARLPDGRPVFANTLFSCVATVSERDSFIPLWKPPFISRLAAEDRCHVNGLAMRDGVPAFVTVVGQSDVADGWREHRRDGGAVLAVPSGEVVATGLSMPHSPRWYGGRLWLLNSGTGEFGWVDTKVGRFEPIAFCPGYSRGLAFAGNFALVGVSEPRDNRTFTGLALDQALADRGTEARCAILVIDLRSGETAHWLHFDGVVRELYDVATIAGSALPAAIGFRSDEIRRVITIGEAPAL